MNCHGLKDDIVSQQIVIRDSHSGLLRSGLTLGNRLKDYRITRYCKTLFSLRLLYFTILAKANIFVLMLSTRQASAEDRSTISQNIQKLQNFEMTIFGIPMANAFKRVQTCLVLVH